MKVSILVPVYGVERYIEQCARSLFEQSYESVEFIFVDDASPDNSIAIVEQLLESDYPHQRSRTKIIRNESNMGVSESRNRALEAATGHFVIFVDGDDWCEREMVEEMVFEQMVANSDVVTSNFYNVKGEKMSIERVSLIGGRRGSLRVVVSQSFDLPNRIWGILLRRDIIMTHAIRFDRRITMGEDYLFLVQLLYYARQICHLSQPTYYYRKDVGATSFLGTQAQRSYIRAVAASRSFLRSQGDYKEFSGALRLSRFNLRRWLLLRKSRRVTPLSAIYRLWCYTLNTIYHLYCISFKLR